MRLVIGKYRRAEKLWMAASLMFLVFAPSAFMVFFGVSSFGVGVIAFSLFMIASFILFYKKTKRFPSRANSLIPVAIFFSISLVFIHFAFVNYVVFYSLSPDVSRFFIGLISLIIVMVAAFFSARISFQISANEFVSMVNVVLFFIFLNVVMSSFKIDFFGTHNIKPSFFFMEPSHIALAASALVMFASVTKRRLISMIVVLMVFLWGLYIENLTTILLGIMCFAVCVRLKIFSMVVAVFAFLFLGYMVFPEVDLSYFVQRFDFSGASENLSVLVFMQGWENSFLNFNNTSWLGVGFQQLGITTVTGEHTQKIVDIMGADLNKYDGGTTGSKLISEFGVFGVLLLVMHACFVVVSFFSIRGYVFGAEKKVNVLFAQCVVVCSVLEVYIRGVGYFSPTMFLFWTSIFVILINRYRLPMFVGPGRGSFSK